MDDSLAGNRSNWAIPESSVLDDRSQEYERLKTSCNPFPISEKGTVPDSTGLESRFHPDQVVQLSYSDCDPPSQDPHLHASQMKGIKPRFA